MSSTRAQLIALLNSKILTGGNRTKASDIRDFENEIIQSVVNLIDDANTPGGFATYPVTQNLQQVLTNGNSTGGLTIDSPDGNTIFSVDDTVLDLYVTNGQHYGITGRSAEIMLDELTFRVYLNHYGITEHFFITAYMADLSHTVEVDINTPIFKWNGNDIATINDILTAIEGVVSKQDCRIGTTSNITLSGLQTIDAKLTIVNDRVLVKDQTTLSENGIYLAQSGAWIRSLDTNTGLELKGALVSVDEGVVNANTTWRQTNNSVTIGTSNVNWVQYASSTPDATATVKGKAKLYASLGTNSDGSIDQNTANTNFNLKANRAGDTFTGSISATNLSGTNTGDNATNTQYSGLASSKENAITATTSADFWSGAKTFINFASTVRATVLTGLSNATSQVIAATDSVVLALGYLQGQINANIASIALKANIASPTFTGTVTTPILNVSGQTASTVPYLDASKNLISSSVTPTQLGYLDATSSVQTQLNAKGVGSIKGTLPATIGLIPFANGTTDTVTTSSNFKFDSTNNVINIGTIPSGYAGFNTFSKGINLTALISTVNTSYCELQTVNGSNVMQIGVEGSVAGGRMTGTKAYNLYFGTYYNYGITFHTNNAVRGEVSNTGNWMIGQGGIATARLQVAGSTTSVPQLNLPNGVAPSSPIQGDVNAVSNRLTHYTNSVNETIAYLSDSTKTNVLGAVAPTALAFLTNRLVTITPTATGTFTSTVPAAGTEVFLIIVTSGVTSYTLTFGSGFLTTGVLVTGIVTAKTYTMSFISDGTTLNELSRTIAM